MIPLDRHDPQMPAQHSRQLTLRFTSIASHAFPPFPAPMQFGRVDAQQTVSLSEAFDRVAVDRSALTGGDGEQHGQYQCRSTVIEQTILRK